MNIYIHIVQDILRSPVLYVLEFSVKISPHGIVHEARPYTLIYTFIVPSSGYLPSMLAFIPALSRVPCKYHRPQDSTPYVKTTTPSTRIPMHPLPLQVHRGGGEQAMTMWPYKDDKRRSNTTVLRVD